MKTTWDILVILDRSGSMMDARTDHEGGLRSFVADQQQLEGDVTFTLVQFDSVNPCEVVYDYVPIATVGAITLTPRGGTPLLDAIGKATAHLEARQVQPVDHTLVLVITDGHENNSREWTKARVKDRVLALEARGWTFLFLGANIDSFAEAVALGMPMAGSANYTAAPASVGTAYGMTARNVLRARTMSYTGATGQSVTSAMNYTVEDQAEIAQPTGKVDWQKIVTTTSGATLTPTSTSTVVSEEKWTWNHF